MAVATLRHPVNPQCKSIKTLASTKVHFVAFMLFHSCAISSELESLILEITKPQLSLRLMFSFLVGKTGFEPATTWSQTRYATGLRYFPSFYNFRYNIFTGKKLKCKNLKERRGRDSNPWYSLTRTAV